MKSFLCSISLALELLSKSTSADPSHKLERNRAHLRRATNDLLTKGIDALGNQKALSSLETYSTSA